MSQITVTGNGSYPLGAGEYKVVTVSDTGGAVVDITYPIAGSVYQFTGAGARELFLSRDTETGDITTAVVSGFTAEFTIQVEKLFCCC